MSECVIHFNMMTELNKLLKDNNIDYTIHAIGGCTCEGVELKCYGKTSDPLAIKTIINEYLRSKFMYVTNDKDNPYIFRVKSLFELVK